MASTQPQARTWKSASLAARLRWRPGEGKHGEASRRAFIMLINIFNEI